MKKVLIVAYGFPPVGGAGVQRPAKFVKYFSEFGWDASVLTVANPSVPVIDESLISDVPAETQIYQAYTLEPSYQKKSQFDVHKQAGLCWKAWARTFLKLIMIPDVQILWWPGLVVELLQILWNEKPDVIFVTAPPFSSFLPVVFLSRIFRVPVVVDFRDEWVFTRNQIENASKGCLARALDYWLEYIVVANCSGFTAATQSYVDAIYERHPKLDRDKGVVITNGFDGDDFKNLNKKKSHCNAEHINIVYTGTVWKATSLKPFLDGLKKAVCQRPELQERIRLKVIGRILDTEREVFEGFRFADMVTVTGYMAHKQVLQEMVNADLLLLTLAELPGAEKIIPGKVFEYLSTDNKIMAVVPQGETYHLLEQVAPESVFLQPKSNDVGVFFRNADLDQLGKKSIRGSVAKYSRKNLTHRLSKMFDALCRIY